MNEHVVNRMKSLNLTDLQSKELKEFIEENDYRDLIDEAIEKITSSKAYLSQSKVVDCEGEECFITNSIAGVVQMENRAYYDKSTLIDILTVARENAEILDD